MHVGPGPAPCGRVGDAPDLGAGQQLCAFSIQRAQRGAATSEADSQPRRHGGRAVEGAAEAAEAAHDLVGHEAPEAQPGLAEARQVLIEAVVVRG